MKHATIMGMGIDLPTTIRRNDAWPESFVEGFRVSRDSHKADDFAHIETNCETRKYDDLYRKHALAFEDDPFKGSRERRVAPPEDRVLDYEVRAARRAIEDAGVDPAEIDLVLSHTLLPDVLGDSSAAAIQWATGAVNAAPVMVESYCSSAVSQLDLACAMVQSGQARHVLCTQSHIINNRVNLLDLPTSPLFGDAATAFVVGPAPAGRGVTHVVRGGDGSLHQALNYVHRDAPESRWYRDARGPVVPAPTDRTAAKRLARGVLGLSIDTIRELCDKAALPNDSIAALIVTQPGPWYPTAVAEGVGVASDRAPHTYDTLAHVGACCTVANLLRAKTLGLLRDGAPIVLYANGAGLTRTAALLRWSSKSGG